MKFTYLLMAMTIVFSSCNEEELPGCIDPTASNYDEDANTDDGTCHYPIAVGDEHDGGIIVHFSESSDNGYVEGEKHGIIAAKEDCHSGDGSGWGCVGVLYGVVRKISYGAGNCQTILDSCSDANSVAMLCSLYSSGGYDDWHLPSLFELLRVQNQQEHLSAINATAKYWSSTAYFAVGYQYAYAAYMATSQGGPNGNPQYKQTDKTEEHKIRVVHYF